MRLADPAMERSRHREMLVLCLLAVGLSFLLRVGANGDVHLPGFLRSVAPSGLPPTCPSVAIFDIRCPGCGTTRAFIEMASLRVGEAWRHNPGGPLLFLLAVLQIPYRLFLLRARRPPPWTRSVWLGVPGYAVILLMLGGWLLALSRWMALSG